jgi:hypothetical protein
MLRRTISDRPAEPTIIGEDRRPVVRKLWKRKRRDGAEISAALWYDSAIEAVLEITINASQAEDVIAEALANGVLRALDLEGAKPVEVAESNS